MNPNNFTILMGTFVFFDRALSETLIAYGTYNVFYV